MGAAIPAIEAHAGRVREARFLSLPAEPARRVEGGRRGGEGACAWPARLRALLDGVGIGERRVGRRR